MMTYTIVKLLLRHTLTAFGTYLVSTGYADAGQVELISGAAMAIAGILWSIYEKRIG
jgi:hypothetical protein